MIDQLHNDTVKWLDGFDQSRTLIMTILDSLSPNSMSTGITNWHVGNTGKTKKKSTDYMVAHAAKKSS